MNLDKWSYLLVGVYWFSTCYPFFWCHSSVKSLSHVRLFATPWTAARSAFLSINSWSFLKLMPIESVMPSKHLHQMPSPFDAYSFLIFLPVVRIGLTSVCPNLNPSLRCNFPSIPLSLWFSEYLGRNYCISLFGEKKNNNNKWWRVHREITGSLRS